MHLLSTICWVHCVTGFHTNKDIIPAAVLLSKVKKPSHLSPGRSSPVHSQWRSGWPQIALQHSPPSPMGGEAVEGRGGRVGSISLADAYPGSAEGSLHPGFPPAPLQPSSPAGLWPTSSPQIPPSPMKHSHRLVPSQGPGSARPIRVWLAQKHPSSEKTFVFSPAHKPGDVHWAIPSETKASSPSKVNTIPRQDHQTHTQATDFYKILNSNLSRTLRRAALGPPTRLPSLAPALTANLVSAQQLAGNAKLL